jgi:branched-chain amino acid transport system substrate-binding protein
MSSPIQGMDNDHLAYAPKRVHHDTASNAEGERRQPSEQSSSEEDLGSNQARVRRLDTTSLRDPLIGRNPRRPLRAGEPSEASEPWPTDRDRLRMARSLEPETLKVPFPPRRSFGRIAALASIIIAAFTSMAVLFIASDFSPKWDEMLRNNTGKAAFGSRYATDTSKISEQPSSPVIQSLRAPPDLQTTGEPQTRVALAYGASERAWVRGITNNEIRFGISAPLSGPAKELGNQMKFGIETAFNLINDAGGINGRKLALVAADDGYEPTRTAETMKQLYEKEQVFGFIGNVGTPTALVGLPYALEQKTLFFGAFTGASLLRRDPPDRYVFNYRASYIEETDAVVRYLVKLRALRPDQIAVFAQEDAYGDAGFAGVAKAMRALNGGDEKAILRLGYKRNTVDVDQAVARLRAHKIPIKAVVMVAAYRAAAKFIEKTRDAYPTMIYTNVSFVGSTALADELMLLGPRYANGVIVTQVVPAVDSYASAILKYKTALAKYFSGTTPDYVSFEGYVAGSVLIEGLKRAGPQFDTETLVDTLETIRAFDMGLGTVINFGPTEHQGSHKVWGTQLNEYGRYQAIDLE